MNPLEAAYRTLKVLVIDDEPMVRTTIRRMLEALGVAEVGEAADGAGGFDEVMRARPDVVLCDIHMVPVDGQAFLERVRESDVPWVRTLPVLFLSGDNSLDTVRLASQSHVDGYMVKPMMRDDLKKQLDIVVTRLAERAGSGRPEAS